MAGSNNATPLSRAQALWELARVFSRLGLTSFGGPVAHIAYFRDEFVSRRRWLSEAQYTDLVALCQFLPGPASSQAGMALGFLRAGWAGALLAWCCFTLPSALLLIGLAMLVAQGGGAGSAAHFPAFAQPWFAGCIHGLKIAAVAVVAQAVWGMGRGICTDARRCGLAASSACLLLVLPGAWTQVLVLVLAATLGARWLGKPAARECSCEALPAANWHVSRRAAWAALLAFALLLMALPLLAASLHSTWLQASAAFYRAGALVFGGGHVVLPLLEAGVASPGWVDGDQFLTGYAAAQAVPGPLFSFAAYLGALLPGALGLAATPWHALLLGLWMLAMIFLPALLLIAGCLPLWASLQGRPRVRRAMDAINASVVGMLLAALYDPVWTSAVHNRLDAALALALFGLLSWARLPALWAVLAAALTGSLLGA